MCIILFCFPSLSFQYSCTLCVVSTNHLSLEELHTARLSCLPSLEERCPATTIKQCSRFCSKPWHAHAKSSRHGTCTSHAGLLLQAFPWHLQSRWPSQGAHECQWVVSINSSHTLCAFIDILDAEIARANKLSLWLLLILIRCFNYSVVAVDRNLFWPAQCWAFSLSRSCV